MEQDGDMKEEEHGKRGKAVRESVSFILYLIVIVVLTFLMIRYVGQRTRVDGSSMENTLTNGDNLIVDKISYRFHEPERFDIIVFPYQYKEDTYFIKRIIGMPGETGDKNAGNPAILGLPSQHPWSAHGKPSAHGKLLCATENRMDFFRNWDTI